MISISVLMPTKNSVEWLDEVLSAIQIQKSEYDIKLVLVDGYSKDGTVEKAREYFPDLIVIYDISRNLAIARNICLDEGRKLKTDYMAFIDSDVIVPFNFFKRMIRHLSNPNVVISATRFELEHDPPKYFVSKHYRNRKDIKRRGIAKTDYTTTACSMWKSHSSEGIVLDERLKRAGEDVDFNLQLIEKGNYYALVDCDEPHSIHIRPATIREELHRVKDHGMARALLMKLHRKSLDPMRYKKTILASILTFMGWIGLISTLFLGRFWMIGLIPFSILFLRHWMKTRDKRRLDYAFFGFLMSTIYLTRFIQGVIKYRNE
ncbi:hypothetical protein ES702_01951 [subsurface metagenome]